MITLNGKSRRKTRTVILGLLVIYVFTYFVMSRQGFARADASGAESFYFLTPHDSAAWRFGNTSLVFIFYPLILIDEALGTGRPIGGEPMWSLN